MACSSLQGVLFPCAAAGETRAHSATCSQTWCLPAAGETIHPWQVLDGVVRGRTVVVLGTASEPLPVPSMAELSPHIREADVLVTSPALQASSLL